MHRTTGARSSGPSGDVLLSLTGRLPPSARAASGAEPDRQEDPHDRRSPGRYDFGTTVEPKLVISSSHVGNGIAASAIPIALRHDLLLILGRFLFGEVFLPASSRGRSNGVIVAFVKFPGGPAAVRCPRRSPFFRRLSPGLRGGGRRKPSGREGEYQGRCRGGGSMLHSNTSSTSWPIIATLLRGDQQSKGPVVSGRLSAHGALRTTLVTYPLPALVRDRYHSRL